MDRSNSYGDDAGVIADQLQSTYINAAAFLANSSSHRTTTMGAVFLFADFGAEFFWAHLTPANELVE